MNEDIKWILEKNAPGITKNKPFMKELNQMSQQLGAPLTAAQIENDLKDPKSLISQAVVMFAHEINLAQEIKSTQELLLQVNLAHSEISQGRQAEASDVDNFFEEYNCDLIL